MEGEKKNGAGMSGLVTQESNEPCMLLSSLKSKRNQSSFAALPGNQIVFYLPAPLHSPARLKSVFNSKCLHFID